MRSKHASFQDLEVARVAAKRACSDQARRKCSLLVPHAVGAVINSTKEVCSSIYTV